MDVGAVLISPNLFHFASMLSPSPLAVYLDSKSLSFLSPQLTRLFHPPLTEALLQQSPFVSCPDHSSYAAIPVCCSLFLFPVPDYLLSSTVQRSYSHFYRSLTSLGFFLIWKCFKFLFHFFCSWPFLCSSFNVFQTNGDISTSPCSDVYARRCGLCTHTLFCVRTISLGA